jgi:bifunctional non-homologous end joining protein LigD
MHVRGAQEISRLMKTIPVAFIAFDLVYLDGRDLTRLTYSERRELLEQTVVTTPWLQLSPAVRGEGTPLFEAAAEQGLEGIVAKKLSSRYELGKRSKSWLKVKTTFDADVVIAGWSQGEGRRTGGLGSLVMAVFDGGKLRYVGGVGTGFTGKTLEMLEGKLRPLKSDEVPFTREEMKGKPELRRAQWVRPELVATIEFRQLTAGGKLRAPSFKGLRDDLDPSDCTYEKLRASAGG